MIIGGVVAYLLTWLIVPSATSAPASTAMSASTA
jgi:phage shock protein PspC (stress-responsive transcriptional regulator)